MWSKARQLEAGGARDQLQAAAGIRRRIAQQRASARRWRCATTMRLSQRVPSLLPIARNQLKPGASRAITRRQQPGNIRRIVLTIAVQRRDPLPARRADARKQRRALAAARGVDAARAGADSGASPPPGAAASRPAAVVDVDDLDSGAGQCGMDFGEQRQDVLCLVAHGDNDRQLHGDSPGKDALSHQGYNARLLRSAAFHEGVDQAQLKTTALALETMRALSFLGPRDN